MKARYCTVPPRPFGYVLAVLISLLLVACDSGTTTGEPMEPGQESWLRYCASCHGNEGQGRPPSFPPVAGSEWLELPTEGLALIVLRGLRGEIEVKGKVYRGLMPPMAHLSDEAVADAVGYMERTWAGREPGLTSESVGRLRAALPPRQPPMDGWQGVQQAMDELD